MGDIDIPEAFAGRDEEERRNNYIGWMSSQLALSYPTTVLADRVVKEEIKIADGLNNASEIREEIGSVLKFQSDEFTIGKGSINTQIRAFEEQNDRLNDETKIGLRRIHRAYQLSPSDQAMQVLLDNKLDSAFAITRYGRKGFLKSIF